jgi:hypothetical protein
VFNIPSIHQSHCLNRGGSIRNSTPLNSNTTQPAPNPLANAHLQNISPDDDIPRACSYYADYSGCGYWRLHWPEYIINCSQRGIVQGSTVIYRDPAVYAASRSIRIQRQAADHQLEFVQWLVDFRKQAGLDYKIIYEVDDIVFEEDIPDYNKFKSAFVGGTTRSNIMKIINLCDEMSVTNDFMRDYFKAKTGMQNITVVPNFPPKFWTGNFFNHAKVCSRYEKHKRRPRILYTGSGAHFDVDNKVDQKDDFHHVIKNIIDTRKKFQWVFIGAFPPPLEPYVRSGEIEFHPWCRLYEYPYLVDKLEPTAMIAPLLDNTFNRAKSDIKFTEANAFGVPIVCQDMITYKDAPHKFNTGDEMIDNLDQILKNGPRYRKNSMYYRSLADKNWLELEDNIECFNELYMHPYGSPKRKHLKRFNP